MSHYISGDVVLVPFPHENEVKKVRPAIVLATKSNGDICLCPIRGNPRPGILFIPISIDDFKEGGLDLFSESYIQIDTVRKVKSGSIIAKKGSVTVEFMELMRKSILCDIID